MSELTYISKIGQGCFGNVFRGECRGKEVAIKKLFRQDLTDKALRDFKREVEICRYAPSSAPDPLVERLVSQRSSARSIEIDQSGCLLARYLSLTLVRVVVVVFMWARTTYRSVDYIIQMSCCSWERVPSQESSLS